MKKETRKARLRRLSYQVAEGVVSQRDITGASVIDEMATIYARGYKQCMRDLRREVSGLSLDTTLRAVLDKFLGGIR